MRKKKSGPVLIFIGVLVVLIGALVALNRADVNSVYAKPTSKMNPETVKLLNDPNYDQIIVPDQLKKKLEAKESGFVYFFAATCPHCRQTTPVLNPMAKELGIALPKFNLDEFAEGWRTYNIKYTPTLVYFKDGKELERLEGGYGENGAGHSKDAIKQFLEKHKGK